MKIEMELSWIGHAGILVRLGAVIIAVDPFLSGTFHWKGQEERYEGRSPWIGSPEKMEDFVKQYGVRIRAICITHDHGDHFDPAAIAAIRRINPAVRIIAPISIREWYKKSAVENGEPPTIETVRKGKAFEIQAGKDVLVVKILPDTRYRFIYHPQRVGYVISRKDSLGVAHLGDSHGIGPGWKQFQGKISDIVSWIKEEPLQFAIFYSRGKALKRVWWIHWESFTPGNFDCGKDPGPLIDALKARGLDSGTLDYTTWKTTGD